jgi:hypothetical protein
VKARRLRFVVDADLGAEVAHEPVQRRAVGRAHVCRREHAERDAARLPVGELGLEDAHAVPLDEGAQQVDAVRGGELGPEFGAELGVAVGVGQQRWLGEGHLRAGLEQAPDAGCFFACQRQELFRSGQHGVRFRQHGEHPIHGGDALIVRERGQVTGDERADVLAQASSGLGLVHRLASHAQPVQLREQVGREETLVHAVRQGVTLRHCRSLADR